MNLNKEYRTLKVIYKYRISSLEKALSVYNNRTVIIKSINTVNYSAAERDYILETLSQYRDDPLPGVTEIIDIWDSDNSISVIMEDFPGITLREYLQKNKPGIHQSLSIAYEIADITYRIHEKKLGVHCLNTSSVFINPETHEIKIVAPCLLPSEISQNRGLHETDFIKKILPYISPERLAGSENADKPSSDLYSIGVILYRMLTGREPFCSDDPHEIIHAHLKEKPVAPAKIDKNIPGAVSDITLRLLEKDYSKRYMLADSIKYDLMKCLDQLEMMGRLESFELDTHTTEKKPVISGRLYGREEETKKLTAFFESMQPGARRVATVYGPSGIGKSTLIKELFRPGIASRCFFISGKCEQNKGEVPYNPLLQAFQELVRELLSESHEGIDIWRESLQKNLAENGQIMIDVIPELRGIIGDQEKVPELDADETRNRFTMVFLDFVHVFSDSRHPLVLFIDDLQWIDTDTLLILKKLVMDKTMGTLMIIGAYRDNEVDEYHNVSITKNEFIDAGISILDIELSPFHHHEINSLFADSLNTSPEKVDKLVDLALAKTKGNPLLLNQFLRSLYSENIIQHTSSGEWNWDIEKIESHYKDEKDTDFSRIIMNRLNEKSRNIISHAACIGNTFNPDLIIVLTGENHDTVTDELNDLQEAGLIRKVWDDYQFTHDRIQEEAYSLIPDAEKGMIHKKIGHHYNAEQKPANESENIFMTANQFNLSYRYSPDLHDPYLLSEINLKAAQMAKHSAAFDSALNYLEFTLNIIPGDSWQRAHEFTYSLFMEAFEACYVSGYIDQAYYLFTRIKENTKKQSELIRLYILNIYLLMNGGKPHMAIMMGTEALKLLGINIAIRPSAWTMLMEKIQLYFRIRLKSREAIIQLPDLKDEKTRQIIAILISMGIPAYGHNFPLMKLIAMKIINLSLRHGNSDLTSYGYMIHGIETGKRVFHFRPHHDFGTIALSLNEKYNNRELESLLMVMYGGFQAHWKHHANIGIDYLIKGYEAGVSTGDIYYSRLACILHTGSLFVSGAALNTVLKTGKRYLEYVSRGKTRHIINSIAAILLNAEELANGNYPSVIKNRDIIIDEIKHDIMLQPLHWYYTFRIRNLYLFGEYEEALNLVKENNKLLWAHYSSLTIPEHVFFSSLVMTALYNKAGFTQRIKFMRMIRKNIRRLKTWAEESPLNFRHKHLLVEAEVKRIKGEKFSALSLYNQAIISASDSGYIQNRAIARRLAAVFFEQNRLDQTAASYLMLSCRDFREWGAERIAEIIENLPLLEKESEDKRGSEFSKEIRKIDLHDDILMISSCMSYEALLLKTVSVIERITCSERSMIMIKKNERWHVEAQKNSSDKNTESILNPSQENIPESIIKKTLRAEAPVFSFDPRKDPVFYSDPYIIKMNPESFLSVPVKKDGEVSAILICEGIKSEDTEIVFSQMKATGNIFMNIAGNLRKDSTFRIRKNMPDDKKTDSVIQELNRLMSEEKLYAIEDLSVSMTAEALSVSSQELSNLLNDRLNVNFNTFVNRFRIEKAKELLRDEPERPVISIAYEVGFNSMSPFYSAFMKFTGLSPTKFRETAI